MLTFLIQLGYSAHRISDYTEMNMSQDRVQRNYMGVIVMNHYQSDEPIQCIGVDRPTRAMCEFALYQGSLDAATNRVHKEVLLASWRMSELQWGKLIGRPNSGDGMPAQLMALQGHSLFPAPRIDERSELAKSIDHVLSEDKQLVRFLREVKSGVDAAQLKGRLTSKESAECSKNLSLFSSYLRGNADFAMQCALESARKRAQEAAHEIYRYSQRVGTVQQPPLLIGMNNQVQGKPLSDLCMMQVGVGSSGSGNLFMDSNEDGFVSIEVKQGVEEVGSVSDDCTIRGIGHGLFKIKLSPSQYARMVRAEAIEIECTIGRLFGQRMDDVEEWLSVESIIDPVVGMSDEEKDLKNAISVILSELSKGAIATKSGLSSITEKVSALNEKYDAFLRKDFQVRERSLEKVMDSQKLWLEKEVDKQLLLLPQSKRKDVLVTLQKQFMLTFHDENK